MCVLQDRSGGAASAGQVLPATPPGNGPGSAPDDPNPGSVPVRLAQSAQFVRANFRGVPAPSRCQRIRKRQPFAGRVRVQDQIVRPGVLASVGGLARAWRSADQDGECRRNDPGGQAGRQCAGRSRAAASC